MSKMMSWVNYVWNLSSWFFSCLLIGVLGRVDGEVILCPSWFFSMNRMSQHWVRKMSIRVNLIQYCCWSYARVAFTQNLCHTPWVSHIDSNCCQTVWVNNRVRIFWKWVWVDWESRTQPCTTLPSTLSQKKTVRLDYVNYVFGTWPEPESCWLNIFLHILSQSHVNSKFCQKSWVRVKSTQFIVTHFMLESSCLKKFAAHF